MSLACEDRLSALIRKERLLRFPDGTAFAGKYMQVV